MNQCDRRCPVRERITDAYIITMLLVFPLFPGFSGYEQITASKFAFLLAATALWAAALLGVSAVRRTALPRPVPAAWAAIAFFAVCALSLLLSPHRAAALLGAGRYDGLLSTLVYVLIFLGVSAFAKPKLLHAQAFAVSVSLCAAIALGQLAGYDPLRLFPAGVGFYDSGLRYSGAFLGTIGNTNILDAVLCLALPLFLSLYICGRGGYFLIPVVLCVPIICRAGGDGAKLSLLLFGLVAGPALLTTVSRVQRAMRALAAWLGAAAFSAALVADYDGKLLRLLPSPGAKTALFAALAVLLLLLSVPALTARFAPPAKSMRRFFLTADIAAVLLGFAAVWFWPGTEGTIYELSAIFHGQLSDSFGSSRIRIWRDCLALVGEHPFFGGGPGTLSLRLDIEFSRYVPETGITLRSFVDNAHNVYLANLVNTGIAGLAAQLCCYILAARSAVKSSDPLSLPFALGALCCAAQDFFGLGLCLSEPLLWIILALMCAQGKTLEAET